MLFEVATILDFDSCQAWQLHFFLLRIALAQILSYRGQLKEVAACHALPLFDSLYERLAIVLKFNA